MKKINLHIEIVRSTKSSFSSMSQKSANDIYEVLKKHYVRVGITIINSPADLEGLVSSRPDLVFLGMKFVLAGQDLGPTGSHVIWLAEYLDRCGILYTGSNKKAHVLEKHKQLAKQKLLDVGLNTPKYYVIPQGNKNFKESKQFLPPFFIKPTNRGGGLGIDSHSVAYNFKQLQAKVNLISTILHADSLVEEYLPGREFSVAILKNGSNTNFFILPIELISLPDKYGSRLLSKEIKSANLEKAVHIKDGAIRTRVATLAIKAFVALGARDYGRIDIRLNSAGVPSFLEANLLPSLIGGYGSFPKACQMNLNLKYEPMILNIVNLALDRRPLRAIA